MFVENFDTLIYGEDGQSPIRPTIVRMLDIVKKDNVRLRIDVRSQAQGTTTSRNEHTLFADPNDNADADGLMRILVERLNDAPGEGFVGQIRINFSQAGAAGERYGSWQRTIRAQNMNLGRVRPEPEDDDEDGGEDDENSPDFSPPRRRGSAADYDLGGGGGRGGVGGGVLLSEESVRLWLETVMSYLFRSQAQQFALHERTSRMLEAYTLRFGFPTQEPGIVESRGGEAPGGAAPGSAGPGGYGLLPMLIQAATKMAAGGGGGSPAPEPAPQRGGGGGGQPPPRGPSQRMLAMQASSQMARRLRPQPAPAEPADGYEEAPEEQDEPEQGLPPYEPSMNRVGRGSGGRRHEQTAIARRPVRDEPQFDEEEYREEGDDGDEYSEGDESGGVPDVTHLTAEQMKAAFLQWVKADPANKEGVMGLVTDPDVMKAIS